MLKFVSLHNHTGFSVYDGLGSVDDYVDWMLKNAGEDSGGFAVTEHGQMNSIGYVASAQRRCKKKGIPAKLIYGCEFYYIPSLSEWDSLKKTRQQEKKEEVGLVIEDEKESKLKRIDPLRRRNHLILLAATPKGLTNLYRLVSKSYRFGMYRKPRIDLEMIRECSEGLVMSSACLAGIPAYHSNQNDPDDLESVFCGYEKELMPLLNVFGKERAYLELQFNRIPEQQIVNRHLIEYSKRTGYKLIATCDSHYPRPELFKDREIYKLLGYQMLKDPNLDLSILDKDISEISAELYLKNGDQMFSAYEKTLKSHYDDDTLIKEAIERTYEIAHNLIEDVVPDSSIKLPSISFIKDKTPFDQLACLCREELKKRGLDKNREYVDRIIYELKIIKEKDTANYFLAMKKIIDIVRSRQLVGPGRGSGAGSLINYFLGITLIDPVEKGLLFERFVSPHRKEVPDIDSDLADRDEAILLLREEFGEENVLYVSNYNTLKLKSLIKDLARLYNIPFEEVNAVTTVMESEAHDEIMKEVNHDQKFYEFTFERAKKYSKTFASFLKKHPDIEDRVINLYKAVKAVSVHAGGVLVLDDAECHLPIIKTKQKYQSPITEGITAQHLQDFGLIKFDLLGLATLKIISSCIKNILKKELPEDVNIQSSDIWDFYNKTIAPGVINEKDEKIFEKVYCGGRFPSIFQFAERGVQNFSVQAKPKSLDDIAVLTSLYRPGPLASGGTARYIENSKKDKIAYDHPILEEVLGKSKGIICFQEQFMELAHKLAGFSLAESNQLRKLLVKPSHELAEEMKQQRKEAADKFIGGCVDKGLLRKRAEKLWYDEILPFCSYGFCHAHAVSYAYNSYQCAWLYTHYEKEWIKACLDTDPDLEETIQVVSSLGYNIKKPDVLVSGAEEWQITGNDCTPPFTAVKGIGLTASNELVNTREKKGFFGIGEFLHDVDEKGKKKFRWSKFNKKSFEVLIKIGAFRSLGCIGKDSMFKNDRHMLNVFISNFNEIKKGKKSLFEFSGDDTDWTRMEKIDIQRDLLGIYDKELLFTPKLNAMIEEYNVRSLSKLNEEKQFIWFIVKDFSLKKTAKKKNYYQLKISDENNKSYRLNYFQTKPEIKRNSIYAGILFKNGQWINVDYNKELIEIREST